MAQRFVLVLVLCFALSAAGAAPRRSLRGAGSGDGVIGHAPPVDDTPHPVLDPPRESASASEHSDDDDDDVEDRGYYVIGDYAYDNSHLDDDDGSVLDSDIDDLESTDDDGSAFTPSGSDSPPLPGAADYVNLWPYALPAPSGSYLAQGPFLQAISATSITVVWRPALHTSTQARVYVGPAPHEFTDVFLGSIDYSGGQQDAVVHVTGLTPSTKYYYTVCSETACARDTFYQEVGKITPSLSMAFTTGAAQAADPVAHTDAGQLTMMQ